MELKFEINKFKEINSRQKGLLTMSNPGSPMIDLDVIRYYFQEHVFPGADLETLNVYKTAPNDKDPLPAWGPVRSVMATGTQVFSNDPSLRTNNVAYDRTQPRPADRFNGEEIDLNRVAVRSIGVSYVSNKTDSDAALHCNYVHPLFSRQFAEKNEVSKKMQGIPLAFSFVPKHANESRLEYALQPVENLLLMDKRFIRSTMLINETNVRNGIVEIPVEICEKAGLPKNPTVYTKNGTKTKLNAEKYFAVPPDHVLAWTLLQTHDQRRRHGIYALDLVVKNRLLYFLVTSDTLQGLHASFTQTWLNRVHFIPLDAIQMSATLFNQEASGALTVTFRVMYMGAPASLTEEFVNRLAPVLPQEFPSFAFSASMRRGEEMAAKIFAAQKETAKKTLE
jgi:hypothetical protein